MYKYAGAAASNGYAVISLIAELLPEVVAVEAWGIAVFGGGLSDRLSSSCEGATRSTALLPLTLTGVGC